MHVKGMVALCGFVAILGKGKGAAHMLLLRATGSHEVLGPTSSSSNGQH